MAVAFSVLVWGGLVAAMVYPFVASAPTPPAPCVYFDEEIQGYDYMPMSEATFYGYTSYCLDASAVPADTYQNIMQDLQKDFNTVTARFGMAAGPAIVILYALLFFFFIWMATAVSMAFIRLNGVRLSKSQYPAFYEIYEKTAHELGLKKVPSAYIIHAAGDLNAFAIKIAQKRMIVIFAELIENLVEGGKLDELHAVAAHELTHIRLKHVNYYFFLMPFYLFPILGKMLSRAREYSADRGAALMCKNKKSVEQALLKLVTGKMVAKEINVDEYLKQPDEEAGFFTWLANIISTHPPVPLRIARVRDMKNEGHEEVHSEAA